MRAEEQLADQQNDAIYRSLEILYSRLNQIVRKTEDVRDLAQQVSFQATLKRLNTASKGEFFQKVPKAYFPPASDSESFERKFKLLRRCTYILMDTMMKLKKSLDELHDATRKQKQDIVKMKKDESDITLKREKPLSNEQVTHINVDSDDEITIIPKVEYTVEQPNLLQVSAASEAVHHVSCTCALEEQIQSAIPFDLKLCIAIESLSYYDQFYLNPLIIDQWQKGVQLKDECISYESIYIRQFKHPQVYLEFARPARGEQNYFPIFAEIQELFSEQTLFLYGMYQFCKQIRENPLGARIGNIKFLLNRLHVASTLGMVINAYSPTLHKCQFLVDMLTAALILNGKSMMIGVNKLLFPECTRNPPIILVRYTTKLNQADQQILDENIEQGYRINQQSSRIPRVVIIFSKEKLFASTVGRRMKHWEIPTDHLNQLCDTYHYQFLKYYIDMVVKSKITDPLAKFFTTLITLVNSSLNVEFNDSLRKEFDKFVKSRNYVSYYQIKTLEKDTLNEKLLEESLKHERVNCHNKDISRLLGVDND